MQLTFFQQLEKIFHVFYDAYFMNCIMYYVTF